MSGYYVWTRYSNFLRTMTLIRATVQARLREAQLAKWNSMSVLCLLAYVRYDTTEEFNVDAKAECDQLNLAHVARKNIKKKKLKQTNAIAHSVQYKMVNGFRYYRALERVSIASALSTALTIYPCQIRVHQRWQSKLQIPTARKKEWRLATTGSSPPCGYLSTLWYTLL